MIDSTTSETNLKCKDDTHYFINKPDVVNIPIDQKCECGLIVYGDLEDIVDD